MNIFEEPRDYDYENRRLRKLDVKCDRCGGPAVLLFAHEYLCENCLCPDDELRVEEFVRTRCALACEENMETTSQGCEYTKLQHDLTESMRAKGMLDPIKQSIYARHGRKANDRSRTNHHYVRSFLK